MKSPELYMNDIKTYLQQDKQKRNECIENDDDLRYNNLCQQALAE